MSSRISHHFPAVFWFALSGREGFWGVIPWVMPTATMELRFQRGYELAGGSEKIEDGKSVCTDYRRRSGSLGGAANQIRTIARLRNQRLDFLRRYPGRPPKAFGVALGYKYFAPLGLSVGGVADMQVRNSHPVFSVQKSISCSLRLSR